MIVRRQVYGDFLPGYLLVFDGQLSGKLPETRGVQDTAHAFQAGAEQPQLLLRQEGLFYFDGADQSRVAESLGVVPRTMRRIKKDAIIKLAEMYAFMENPTK